MQDSTLQNPVSKEAYYGLAGQIVDMISPKTEADPVGILLQLLIGFGNAVGRSAYFSVESSRHYPNTFGVLVGDSSNGRKGTSWAQVSNILEAADHEWKTTRVTSGATSGEGLIWNVRDGDDECEGVRDKRLLLVESEFASVLKVMAREGNTLSAVIRNAWDTGDLRTLTKNNSARASNAHISIIGHITRTELLKYLSNTEAANGFGNRFLWARVRRARILPNGGRVDPDMLNAAAEELGQAMTFARTARDVTRSPEAEVLWERIYAKLTEERYGLLGSMTSRAAPQVVRLSLIYALLDRSTVITPDHLNAALALWNYCDESCKAIFGDSLGDSVADRILDELLESPNGLSRTQISNLFARNKSTTEIKRSLALLEERKLASKFTGNAGDGRPEERWYAHELNERTVS